MKHLFIILALIGLTGCAGTQNAYRAADGVDEIAFVIGEHYYAVLNEATKAKEEGRLTGSNLLKAQRVAERTAPVILSLTRAGEAYQLIQNAETESALQIAIVAAAQALTELIDAVQGPNGELSDLNRSWSNYSHEVLAI